MVPGNKKYKSDGNTRSLQIPSILLKYMMSEYISNDSKYIYIERERKREGEGEGGAPRQ